MTLGNGRDQATLEYSLKYNPPIDAKVAEPNLREAKQIFDRLRVTFLLNSGTCLGAIRDKAFISWDDDIDLISVLGINGLTEETRSAVANALTESGYFVGEQRVRHYKSMSVMKDYVRVDWSRAYPVEDHIYSFPGIPLPAGMFINPKEIDFLGEKFLVPNPPEEYLRLKYGDEWMVPNRPGVYEQDVVAKIPDAEVVGRPSRISVLDHLGNPVPEAEIWLVGGGRFKCDHYGYAQVILPGPSWCALVIRYPGHEQILYMEELEPDKTYVYRADSITTAASRVSGEFGTLGVGCQRFWTVLGPRDWGEEAPRLKVSLTS